MAKQPQNQLYALDPALEARLTLSSFEDKFDLKEFIGSVSDKLIAKSQEEPGPFTPVPFIRTFESVVDRLITIRKDLQQRTEQMEKSVKQAEREFSTRMKGLNDNFEASILPPSSISSPIAGGLQILESVHASRLRAQAAHDLIDFYIQFSRNDVTKLDVLRKEGGKEGRMKLAILLRRMKTTAKEVDIPIAEQVKENVDKYCEKFEKDMLRLFDRSYRKGDPTMMAHCAKVLLEFNGGDTCVRIYVNQHTFFIGKSGEVKIPDADEVWEPLPDPDEPPPANEPGLAKLYREIKSTVGEEVKIVEHVFPNPGSVVQIFLMRVFAQSIQQYLEALLNRAAAVSALAFLRILKLAHAQTTSLVEFLKSYDPSTALFRYNENKPSATSRLNNQSSTPGPSVALSMMLDGAMEELFVPYTEGQRYIEKELKSLSELYILNLYPFGKWHESVSRSKTSGGFFDRMKNQLASTAAATSSVTGNATATAQAAQALLKYSGINPNAANKESEYQPVEDDGKLKVEVAEKMLKWHAESIGRCVELSAQGDLPKNVFSLMRTLSDAIGRGYVETALETAQNRLDTRDPKLEPEYSILSVIRQVELICHLWQQYVSVALLPLASSSIVVRREMALFNNQVINRIEGLTTGVLQRLADATVKWLTTQLGKQKKTDFKPRNDDLSQTNTEACQASCNTLKKVHEAAKEFLSGGNQESFLMEIGVNFHSLLLDHLKKFPVSATGGVALARDLRSYQEAAQRFNIPIVDERFEFLRLLGNLFMLPHDAIKQYTEDNALGGVDLGLLKPYLMQRSDWGSFSIAGMDGSSDPTPVEQDTGTGLMERFGSGRLGTMMKELENLRIGTEDLKLPSLPTMPTMPSMPSMPSRPFGLGAPSA
ncbi:related to exocyst complex 100 kDa component [Serendipita indica DSM 11827]|uniref:Related to exocyst complex 100 kDa component n=1 Tax=Serendipita indica (strain DSM 11827) TaxID=1109443 RepID=G4T9Y0_SERID|nr:related to exocyst complex 100 kDa component [Serendipita indica DSM 11827]